MNKGKIIVVIIVLVVIAAIVGLVLYWKNKTKTNNTTQNTTTNTSSGLSNLLGNINLGALTSLISGSGKNTSPSTQADPNSTQFSNGDTSNSTNPDPFTGE